jgi:uncharacterized protein
MNDHLMAGKPGEEIKMDQLRPWIERHQMAVFILLAYLLSWAVAIPMQGGLIPHGPMMAAFAVLAIVSGRRGVASLWRQMTPGRAGWKWYLMAPGIFIAFHLITLAISLAMGTSVTNTAHLRSLPAYLGVIAPLIFLGGWWEEPGWTGYALKRFQERFEQFPLAASLATGLIRMFWHTPLLAYGKIPWYDFIFYSFAMQIVLTWLYNRSHGSVLVAMIGHLFSNIMFSTMYPLFSAGDQVQYWRLLVAVVGISMLCIIVATRGELGMRTERRPEPAVSGS